MAWTPEESDLGSINEMVNFDHTITYSVTDESTGQSQNYNVTISPTEVNPNTIVINGNKILGYYFDSFPITVQYLTKSQKYISVDKFTKIDETILEQMVSYKANTSISKVFTYNAVAKSVSGTIVSQKIYTKTVTNDWTSGRDSLVYYVGKT